MFANELLLRKEIIQKMVSGWNTADSFRLPESPHWSERIGKEPAERSTNVVELEYSPETQLVENTSQETISTVHNALGKSSVELGNEYSPVEIPALQP